MTLFLMAWRASARMPTPVVRGLAASGAWCAWVLRPRPVRRLEDNLHRVTGVQGRPLRRLTRRSLASTARYYAEVMEMPRMTPEMINARVRIEGGDGPRHAIDAGGTFVVALSHSGNWDLTGAYACLNYAPVTSVAEILEPREVFDQFVALREQVGMTILGHEGSGTFRALISRARSQGGVLALVADRDMSGSGIEVQMWDRGVRVAPGPAALALATGAPLFSLMVRYERLTGQRRRLARSRWGIVLEFSPEISVPDGDKTARVAAMTQAWADWMAAGIARTPEDWHMMQPMAWTS